MATISCNDCGAERTGCPRNTRYCKPCRLLRDVRYWKDRRRTCKTCRESFAPLGSHDYFCAKHADDWSRYAPTVCGLCLAEKNPIQAGVALCIACARATTQRRNLVDALVEGQRLRRITSAESAAAHAAYLETVAI